MNDRDLEVVEREARSMAREQENERNNREAAEYVALQNIAAVVAMYPALDLLLLSAAQHTSGDAKRQGRIFNAVHDIERGIDKLRDLLKPGA